MVTIGWDLILGKGKTTAQEEEQKAINLVLKLGGNMIVDEDNIGKTGERDDGARPIQPIIRAAPPPAGKTVVGVVLDGTAVTDAELEVVVAGFPQLKELRLFS